MHVKTMCVHSAVSCGRLTAIALWKCDLGLTEAVTTITVRELSDTMKPWLKSQKRTVFS
jgi:hypothetical protein